MTLAPAIDAIGGLALLLALPLGGLAVRRRFLSRRGGTFDCSLRLKAGSGASGWTLGVARYAGEQLEWYRVFSYALRPKRVLVRRGLQVVDQRPPHGAETFSLLAGAVVVRCLEPHGPVELAMSKDTLTGFMSWVESSPPGIPAP